MRALDLLGLPTEQSQRALARAELVSLGEIRGIDQGMGLLPLTMPDLQIVLQRLQPVATMPFSL